MKRISLSLSLSLHSSLVILLLSGNMTDVRKKTEASREKNVTSPTVSRLSDQRQIQRNEMRVGRQRRTSKLTPTSLRSSPFFICIAFFYERDLDQCWNEAAPTSDRSLSRDALKDRRVLHRIAKLYNPRIPLAYRYYLFAIALTFPSCGEMKK